MNYFIGPRIDVFVRHTAKGVAKIYYDNAEQPHKYDPTGVDSLSGSTPGCNDHHLFLWPMYVACFTGPGERMLPTRLHFSSATGLAPVQNASRASEPVITGPLGLAGPIPAPATERCTPHIRCVECFPSE